MLTESNLQIEEVTENKLTIPKMIFTNEELEEKLHGLVSDERKRTAELLQLIGIADQRKLYLLRGYGSLFDWLTKCFSYSESAAHRRIQAARFLTAVPGAARKITSGEVNLTTLAKTQGAIRFQEKMGGGRITAELKSQVLEKIENKSLRETEKVLVQTFPKFIHKLEYERKTVISEDVTKLTLNLSGETLKNLERVKELLAHAMPEATFAQVIGVLAKDYLKRRDPLHEERIQKREAVLQKKEKDHHVGLHGERKENPKAMNQVVSSAENSQDEAALGGPQLRTLNSNSAVAKRRVNDERLSVAVRERVIQRDRGRCTYKDQRSGQVCGRTFQIEVDHILPRALGGGNQLSNLRCLCRNHNQWMAEQKLGPVTALSWKTGLLDPAKDKR